MRKRSRKTWIAENWKICRQIVFIRALGKCEKCKGEGREVDHCFSRNNKEIFYEIRNLTLLCSECHSHKTYRRYGFDLAIYELVEEREGSEVFNEMRSVSEKRGSFAKWQYIDYHEKMNKELKEKLSAINQLVKEIKTH